MSEIESDATIIAKLLAHHNKARREDNMEICTFIAKVAVSLTNNDEQWTMITDDLKKVLDNLEANWKGQDDRIATYLQNVADEREKHANKETRPRPEKSPLQMAPGERNGK